MKPYLFLCLLFLLLNLSLDILFRTRLFTTKKFWAFQLIVLILTALYDHFAAGMNLFLYDQSIIIGAKIFKVPIEDFLFGFNLITLNLIIFTRSNKRQASITNKP
jgi:lycopene cyclase domain-containing protein